MAQGVKYLDDEIDIENGGPVDDGDWWCDNCGGFVYTATYDFECPICGEKVEWVDTGIEPF